MKIKQKTIVERMKPLYPALTQPIVSAVARGKAGVQYTNSFRRNAEERGILFAHDRDGRATPCKLTVRLTDDELKTLDELVMKSGGCRQSFLRDLVLKAIQAEGARIDRMKREAAELLGGLYD